MNKYLVHILSTTQYVSLFLITIRLCTQIIDNSETRNSSEQVQQTCCFLVFSFLLKNPFFPHTTTTNIIITTTNTTTTNETFSHSFSFLFSLPHPIRNMDDDEDDDDDDDELSQWCLRRCCALTIDNMSLIYGDALLPVLLPLIQERFQLACAVQRWPELEVGVLAAGALAVGCAGGVDVDVDVDVNVNVDVDVDVNVNVDVDVDVNVDVDVDVDVDE